MFKRISPKILLPIAGLALLTAGCAALATEKQPITLGQVRKLSPKQAGELILRERTHRPIQSIEVARRTFHPTRKELYFFEVPAVTREGCVRNYWRIDFTQLPGTSENDAKFDDSYLYPVTEITIKSKGKCVSTRYAVLGRNVSVSEGFSALEFSKSILLKKNKVKFKCTNETAAEICESESKIFSELTKDVVFFIESYQNKMRLGFTRIPYDRFGPPQIVTSFIFDKKNHYIVEIDRRFPYSH